VPSWTCPACKRQFGRKGQGHECAPAMSEEEYFSTGPERERPIYEEVRDHLESLGPVHVEFVSVGVFFKRSRTFVELRPKTKWVALSFIVHRNVDSDRIGRRGNDGNRYYHVVNVREPSEIDDEVRDWLTESYLASPE
jgi:predicted transport protein